MKNKLEIGDRREFFQLSTWNKRPRQNSQIEPREAVINNQTHRKGKAGNTHSRVSGFLILRRTYFLRYDRCHFARVDAFFVG
jgi:hypothetical protein